MKKQIAVLSLSLVVSAFAQAAAPKSSMRLSCTLYSGGRQDAYYLEKDEVMYTSFYVTKHAGLEYLQSPGSNTFKCVLGCENPLWSVTKSDPLTEIGFVLPQGSDPESVSPMPQIEWIEEGGVPALKITTSAVLKSWFNSDKVFKKLQSSTVSLERYWEIYSEAKVEEAIQTASPEEVAEKVLRTGQPEVMSHYAWTELRCQVIAEDGLSQAQIDHILAAPPAEGRISFKNYETNHGNIIHKPEGLFSEVVEMAKKIDPAHLKASIRETENYSRTLIKALRQIAPEMRKLMAEYPDMQNGQAWAAVCHYLRIQPMSPSGINGIIAMPLILAEDAEKSE